MHNICIICNENDASFFKGISSNPKVSSIEFFIDTNAQQSISEKRENSQEQFDIVLLHAGEKNFEYAIESIKNGLHLLLTNSYSLSANEINYLRQLSIEMGVHVLFSGLANTPVNLSYPFTIPFIANLTRTVSVKGTNREFLINLIRFDLTSLALLCPYEIRKIRVYELPLCSSTPSKVMVLIDFNNNSASTYHLNLNPTNSAQLTVDVESQQFQEEVSIYNPTNQFQLSKDTDMLISSIETGKEPLLGFQLAGKSFQILDAITKKLGWEN